MSARKWRNRSPQPARVMPAIPALGRLRQVDHYRFKAKLSYILRTSWAT